MNRDKKRRSRGRRGTRGERGSGAALKIVAAAVMSVAALGGLSFAGYQYASKEHIDEYGCYAREDQHQSVIFIDNSLTHQSGSQLRDYMIGAMAAYRKVPANGRISIVTSARDIHANLTAPVFVMCKPAKTEREQKALGIPVDGQLVRRRNADEAQTAFKKAIKARIEETKNGDKLARNSPILEQLRAISRAPWFQGRARSLLAITDGIQATRVAEFCAKRGHMPSFDKFARKPGYQWVKPDSFGGTDVMVLMVEIGKLPNSHQPYCSGFAEVRSWWRDYFVANGADHVSVEPLGMGVGN